MGKNKKKINNIFKVAGAKSLKLKSKAKAVKTDLKHINLKNKNKITEVDKALVQLEDKIRQTVVPKSLKKEETNVKSKLPSINREEAERTEQKSNEAIAELDKMQL